MASSATRVEYRVGYTKLGQKVVLIGEREGHGQIVYSIKKEASSQRDEDDWIRGLSADVILAMAEAVRESAS